MTSTDPQDSTSSPPTHPQSSSFCSKVMPSTVILPQGPPGSNASRPTPPSTSKQARHTHRAALPPPGVGHQRAPRPVGITASAAAVLRATQKDASFVQQLNSAVADVVHRTAGASAWLQHHGTVTLATDLLYAALTTLSLRQTLGEEYTGLLQVNASRTGLPSVLSRYCSVFFHCCGPLVFTLSQRLLQTSLRSGWLSTFLRPELSATLLRHAATVRYAATFIQQAHLAVFYLQGIYYHLAKRLAGIRHVAVRRWLNDPSSSGSLRLLGRLLLLQMTVQLLHRLYNKLQRRGKGDPDVPGDGGQEDNTATNVYVSPSSQCSLCLCARVQPTLCTCGHVFCWRCVHTALRTAGHHCPLCRFPVEPRQLVPLVNFK